MKSKFNRNQRIACITKVLLDNPYKIINLNKFTQMFNAAKSTISEDIVIIREGLSKLAIGKIETVSGASGGVRYISKISYEESKKFIDELCEILMQKERIMTGNFLYMTDVLYNPSVISKAAVILASQFNDLGVDYVVTVETKGIPLAFEVARILGVQLIIVRRDTKVTEGPTVSINYISGSTKRIQTMSLAKKSLKKGSKCIFIDDFMKAGGTACGIVNLLKEFESELMGIGVLIDDNGTSEKLVEEYISLIDFKGIDEDGNVNLNPSEKLTDL